MTTEAVTAPARKRIWTWLLSGLAAAILASAAWSCFSPGSIKAVVAPIKPTVIPDPNGYDDVLAAGRAIEKARTGVDIPDLEKADEATLIPLVEASREALAQGRQGLDRPFQVPVVYDMNDFMNRLMNESAAIRGLARILFAQGRLAEIRGQVDDAMVSFLDLARLGDAMSHRVPMLPYQVSVAIQTMGLHGLRDLRTKLSPDQCRRVIAVLQDLDEGREPAADVILREHHFMAYNLNKMGMMARFSMAVSGVFAKDKARVASTLQQNAHRLEASRRLLLADLAVRVYRLERGELPPDLDALVPSILKTVPIDPYGGQPLTYHKLANDRQLYSVGPDGDDDHLTPTLPRRHTETDNGDLGIDSF
jgi:hypothetical protein